MQTNFDNADYLINGLAGLNKLEYFAAHAPKIVPEWFSPVMPPKPKRMPDLWEYFGMGGLVESEYLKYYNSELEEFNEEKITVPQEFKDQVSKYIGEYNSNWEAGINWERNRNKQTIAQWPWYWANEVLNKKPNQ